MAAREQDQVIDALFQREPTTPAEQASVLDLYKVYVDSMEKAVLRRQSAHSFFMTVNSFVMTVAGLLLTKDYIKSAVSAVPLMVASTAGLLLSIVW